MKYSATFVTVPPVGTSVSMNRYLLDANVLSEPMKLTPNIDIIRHMTAHRHNICTASLVWGEMLFGFHRMRESGRRRDLEHYLFDTLRPSLTILPFDQRAAAWHASERARLGGIGLTPPFVDSQIAAVAFVNDLILVTANTADFSNFDGLRVEDWTDPDP